MEGGKVLELDLHGKKLKVLKDLDKLKSLRVLDASCNLISKIQGLSGSKALRELKLYGNSVELIDGLEKLTELCHLSLHFNKISSIGRGLRNCHKLQILRLDHNLLDVVSGGDLAPCSASLTHLDLGHNQLHTVEGLGSLSNLVELNLENNCLKLTELNLSSNPLDPGTLKPLQLKILKLGSIQLSSLACLPKLPHLQDLHVPHNALTALDDCHTLFPSLELLNVRENLLESAQALAPLGKWAGLVELEVEGNPLCSKSDNHRADISGVLPRIETLDGVSLVTGSGIRTHRPAAPLMRPLTPSTIGPTLGQMERELMEADMQLQNYSSQIAAKFDLLRIELHAHDGHALEKANDETQNGRPGNADCRSQTSDQTSEMVLEGNTQVKETCMDRKVDAKTGEARSSSDEPSADYEMDACKRPPTRSGSRARLRDALIYASERYSHQ